MWRSLAARQSGGLEVPGSNPGSPTITEASKILGDWTIPINFETWITLAMVLMLGAIMPGPSLALIVRNTLFGGRRYGVATGIGHGIGFGIYAFLAATGIAVTLKNYPEIDNFLRVIGVVVLLYLAQSFIRSASKTEDSSLDSQGQRDANSRVAFIQGFSVAFFNPKILAWMLTMYSPFVEATMSNATLIGMGILGMCTDGFWYVTVATVLSTSGLLDRLRQREIMITRSIGVILFFYAIFLLFRFDWIG